MRKQQAPAAPAVTIDTIIDHVSRDKGIDRKVLIEAVEAAIQNAAHKALGPMRQLEARYNLESGQVDLFQYMKVVEHVADEFREVTIEEVKEAGLEADVDEELGFQIFYLEHEREKWEEQEKKFGKLLRIGQRMKGFGRIAAQTARQVINHRIRDAEREIVYREYKDRKGELVTGIVRRYEKGAIIVDLGRAEAVLDPTEQVPRESYRIGDRIQAYVKDVDREAKGPPIRLSRADIGLLIKLFEQEVPEIYEGIVRIVSAAREPGSRSKIAVASRDADVDPVGACVGMKGARVQAVVQELRGEKVDIVEWDKDPARFVCNAIAPAEVARVIIDEAEGSMQLIVPDDKLSLAIGRRGQNVRLASQLTNWKLDIVGETAFAQLEEEAIQALSEVDGVGPELAHSMYKLGFRTLEDLVEADPAEVAAIPGLGGAETAARIKAAAETRIEQGHARRVAEALAQGRRLGERERLGLVRGLGQRAIENLRALGYGTLESICDEDPDRFALRTGLGIHRARQIIGSAVRLRDLEARLRAEGKAPAPPPPPEGAAAAAETEAGEGEPGDGAEEALEREVAEAVAGPGVLTIPPPEVAAEVVGGAVDDDAADVDGPVAAARAAAEKDDLEGWDDIDEEAGEGPSGGPAPRPGK
jgi:N utilization substance protein A